MTTVISSINVDHIVSIEMFEHVGPKNHRTYFKRARQCISKDGVFRLQTILANELSPVLDPWLDKYIFPNAVLPTLGEIATAAQGLFVIQDVPYLRRRAYEQDPDGLVPEFPTRWPMIAKKYGDKDSAECGLLPIVLRRRFPLSYHQCRTAGSFARSASLGSELTIASSYHIDIYVDMRDSVMTYSGCCCLKLA